MNTRIILNVELDSSLKWIWRVASIDNRVFQAIKMGSDIRYRILVVGVALFIVVYVEWGWGKHCAGRTW